MEIALPLTLLIVFMMGGLPVALSLGVSGIVGIWMYTGDFSIASAFMGLVPLTKVTEFTLLALPMFLLLAYAATVSGLADEIYTAASSWLSGIRGGLPIATVMAGGAVGALSGTTLASASALSATTVRNQIRLGYSPALASGTAALASTVAVLIPPSILMIVYGVQTQTSVGDLLVAGVVPGLLLLAMLALALWIWVRVKPESAPRPFKTPWADRLTLTTKTLPAGLIMVGVFAALYTGLVTPTEVAALGAIAVIAYAAIARKLKWSALWEASVRAVQATSMIMLIVICGTVFARYLALTGLPQQVSTMAAESGLNRWVVLLLIVLAYFVMSMFMDELPLVVLTLPITFPIITSLGFDPVWFGVITMFLVILGLVFPPVGMIVFVVSATSGVRSSTIFRGTAILLIPVLVTLALVMVFPQLTLWLPSLR